jgi:hypothetical protein
LRSRYDTFVALLSSLRLPWYDNGETEDDMRRIRDLRKYGLPETLLQIWEQQQGEFLLPVQEVAVQ